MSWTTPQEHIAAHCRGGKYDPAKSVDQNVSAFNLQCLIGMIETGEVQYSDLDAVGGAVLVEAVAKHAKVNDK